MRSPSRRRGGTTSSSCGQASGTGSPRWCPDRLRLPAADLGDGLAGAVGDAGDGAEDGFQPLHGITVRVAVGV